MREQCGQELMQWWKDARLGRWSQTTRCCDHMERSRHLAWDHETMIDWHSRRRWRSCNGGMIKGEGRMAKVEMPAGVSWRPAFSKSCLGTPQILQANLHITFSKPNECLDNGSRVRVRLVLNSVHKSAKQVEEVRGRGGRVGSGDIWGKNRQIPNHRGLPSTLVFPPFLKWNG